MKGTSEEAVDSAVAGDGPVTSISFVSPPGRTSKLRWWPPRLSVSGKRGKIGGNVNTGNSILELNGSSLIPSASSKSSGGVSGRRSG